MSKPAACAHWWCPVSIHFPVGEGLAAKRPNAETVLVCIMCLCYTTAKVKHLGYSLDEKTIAAQRERRRAMKQLKERA